MYAMRYFFHGGWISTEIDHCKTIAAQGPISLNFFIYFFSMITIIPFTHWTYLLIAIAGKNLKQKIQFVMTKLVANLLVESITKIYR